MEKGGRKKYITGGMEDVLENSKVSLHSAHASGKNECL